MPAPVTSAEAAQLTAAYWGFAGVIGGAAITGVIGLLTHFSTKRKHDAEIRLARGDTVIHLIELRQKYRLAEGSFRAPLAEYSLLLDTLSEKSQEIDATRDSLCAAFDDAIPFYTDLVDYQCDVYKNEHERILVLVEECVEVLRRWTRILAAINRSDVLRAISKSPLKFNHRDLTAFRRAASLVPAGTEGRDLLLQEITALIDA